jgi:hypothetical protein
MGEKGSSADERSQIFDGCREPRSKLVYYAPPFKRGGPFRGQPLAFVTRAS